MRLHFERKRALGKVLCFYIRNDIRISCLHRGGSRMNCADANGAHVKEIKLRRAIPIGVFVKMPVAFQDKANARFYGFVGDDRCRRPPARVHIFRDRRSTRCRCSLGGAVLLGMLAARLRLLRCASLVAYRMPFDNGQSAPLVRGRAALPVEKALLRPMCSGSIENPSEGFAIMGTEMFHVKHSFVCRSFTNREKRDRRDV